MTAMGRSMLAGRVIDVQVNCSSRQPIIPGPDFGVGAEQARSQQANVHKPDTSRVKGLRFDKGADLIGRGNDRLRKVVEQIKHQVPRLEGTESNLCRD